MSPPASNAAKFRHAAAALLLALVAIAIDASGAIEGVELRVRDAMLRFAAEVAPSSPAVAHPDAALVALDARSLRARPDWPWPRSLHALVIERLHRAGARAVVFDIDFSTPTTEPEDSALAQASREFGPVVFASFRQIETVEGAGEIEITNVPPPELVASSAGVGSVLVPVDSDGVVRRAPISSSIAARDVPSLAIRALEVVVGEGGLSAIPEADEAGYFTIDYRRADPPIKRISAIDIIEDRFAGADVAGRTVFVGATSAEFQDLWTTPMGPATPGVEIQAMAYRTAAAKLAGHESIRTPSAAFHAMLLIGLSLVLSVLGSVSQRGRIALICAAAFGVTTLAMLSVVASSVLLSPLLALLVIGGHYVLGIEGVQRSFARRIRAQESSLEALVNVGEISTARPGTGDALEITLGMLGDVVGATRVSLLRSSTEGQLDGTRIDWIPSGSDAGHASESACDLVRAQQTLDERRAVTLGRSRASRSLSGIMTYVPLRSDESAIGVLVVECGDSVELDLTQVRTIASVGAQLALSAQNLRLIEELRHTFDSSIAAMASAVEARDGYTNLHCRRLAAFSAMIGERVGLDHEEIHAITLGALLHDVGKIGICDAVLNKPGRFTDDEREMMQEHPVIGVNIVRPVRGLSQTTLDCVLHHHERWDGSGYPKGLAGDEIPLAARIVSVVDVWDALSSERPYKPAYPQEKVLDLLRKGRGAEFDPEIVDLFLKVLDEQGDEMLELIQRDHIEIQP